MAEAGADNIRKELPAVLGAPREGVTPKEETREQAFLRRVDGDYSASETREGTDPTWRGLPTTRCGRSVRGTKGRSATVASAPRCERGHMGQIEQDIQEHIVPDVAPPFCAESAQDLT